MYKIDIVAASVCVIFFWKWTLRVPDWMSGSESTVVPHDPFSVGIAIVSNVTIWSKGNYLLISNQNSYLPWEAELNSTNTSES